MSKLRYWNIGCTIGFTSPCNRTKKLDLINATGMTEEELEEMSDEEATEQARELAEEWANEQLGYWAKPS